MKKIERLLDGIEATNKEWAGIDYPNLPRSKRFYWRVVETIRIFSKIGR